MKTSVTKIFLLGLFLSLSITVNGMKMKTSVTKIFLLGLFLSLSITVNGILKFLLIFHKQKLAVYLMKKAFVIKLTLALAS